MKMPHKRQKRGLLSAKIATILIAVAALLGVIAPIAGAKGPTLVDYGADNLQAAIDNADAEDVLQLKGGSYSSTDAGKTLKITKPITIEGTNNGGQSRIFTPIVIELEEQYQGQTVTLKDFTSSAGNPTPNSKFITVNSKAEVKLENLIDFWAGRPDSGQQAPEHDAASLYITDQANGSTITANNCFFYRPFRRYGIELNASNITLNMNGGSLSGRNAIYLGGGSGNHLTFSNLSNFGGRFNFYHDPDAIIINNQNNTEITFNHVPIEAAEIQGKIAGNVFTYTGTNQDVKIKLLSGTTVNNTAPDGAIFNFGAETTPDNNLTIEVDGTETITTNGQESTTAQRYNTDPDYAVIGVYDQKGAGTIKLHKIGETISEITTSPSADGYVFKDWYKDKKFENKLTDEDKTTRAETNLDIYPKFAELVNLSVVIPSAEDYSTTETKSYQVEKGTKITEGLQNLESKLDELKGNLRQISQTQSDAFRGYLLHDKEGGDAKSFLKDVDTDADQLINKILDETISSDTTIEGSHQYTVKINNTTFNAKPNQTMADLRKTENENDNAFDNAMKQNSNGHDFWRFADEKNGIFITGEKEFDSYHITQNLDLTSKYYMNVHVDGNGQAFPIGEGEALNTKEDILSAMNGIKECTSSTASSAVGCEPSRFSHFVDEGGTLVEPTTKVEQDMTIKAIFDVEITINGRTFLIDKGSTINDDTSGKKSAIQSALEELRTVPEGHEHKGFTIAPAKTDDPSRPTTYQKSGDNLDELIQQIVQNHTFNYDSTIYANTTITITIKSVDNGDVKFENLEAGKTIDEYIKDGKITQEAFDHAIYGQNNQKKERFYRLVQMQGEVEGDTFTTASDLVTTSITLKPKFYYEVTLRDEDADDITAKVEEGTPYDSFIGTSEEIQTAQNWVNEKSDGIHLDKDNYNKPSLSQKLHFESFDITKKDGGDTVEDSNHINEDIVVQPIYHYDLDIVEEYGNTDSVKGYTVHKGVKPSEDDDKTNIEKSLTQLENSTKSGEERLFYRFVDQQSAEEGEKFTREELLNKAHNQHLYINAIPAYQVKIGDTVGYVPEGKTIAEALDKDLQNKANLVTALNNLQNAENKTFVSYEVTKGNITGEPLTAETITQAAITEPTEINAKYNVSITIDGETKPFEIEEGQSLSSLEPGEQARAKAALQNLYNSVQSKTFLHFSDGSREFGTGKVDAAVEEAMEQTFDQNATIKASFQATVYIDDNKIEDVGSSDTLKTLDEKGALDTYKNGGKGKAFSRFVDEATSATYPFDRSFGDEKDVKLTTKYGYEVTLGDDGEKFVFEEGETLAKNHHITDNDNFAAALKALKTQPGKTFSRFVDTDGNTINEAETIFSKNTTIKPVFSVTVTIQGLESDGTLTCTIDEGKALNTGSCTKAGEPQELATFLASLERTEPQSFKEYTTDPGFQTIEKGQLAEQTFDQNTTVTAQYEVTITVKDRLNSEVSITIPYGDTYGAHAEDLKSKVDAQIDKDTYSGLSHFELKDGTRVEDSNQFTEHTTLTPKFNVKLTIVGIDGSAEILEGSPARAATDLVEKLTSNPDKDFKSFQDGKGLDDTIVDTNTTLKPQYTINVQINDDKPVKLDEGQSLADHPDYKTYTTRSDFKEFRDKDGNKIENTSDPLHKHTKFIAVYKIFVTVPEEFTEPSNNRIELESGDSLSQLGSELLNKMKQPDATGRTFSHFVDGKGKEIKEDEPLFEDTEIHIKYNNKITFVPYANGETVEGVDPAELTLELGEDRPLDKLESSEYNKLTNWLKQVSDALASQGKTDYNPTSYLEADDSSVIDLGTTLFAEGDKIHVIFTYSPTPVVPDTPETPPVTESSTEKVSPKAPNTGTDENDAAALAVAGSIFAILVTSALMFEVAKHAHIRK